jgi:hypothetical protein
MFEVQVFSQGVNVALQATANQSSTFISGSGTSFDASNAIDGDDSTFSHTRDSSSWWEVDLGGIYSVESVNIKNRWCKNPSDPNGCLCKLSYATVSLVDGNGALVASASTNNTCGMLNVHLPDLNPSVPSTRQAAVQHLQHHASQSLEKSSCIRQVRAKQFRYLNLKSSRLQLVPTLQLVRQPLNLQHS